MSVADMACSAIASCGSGPRSPMPRDLDVGRARAGRQPAQGAGADRWPGVVCAAALTLGCASDPSRPVAPGQGAAQAPAGGGELPYEEASAPRAGLASGGPALTEEQVRWRTALVLGGGLLGVAAYGASAGWYDDLTGELGTESEDWFGEHTYAGGADKLGHAFSGYLGSRLFAGGLRWAGNDPQWARTVGAATTLGILVGVELLDGYERGHQFSWEDLVADAVGVGFGVAMERYPEWDRLLDFRLQYWPSDAERRAGHESPGGDYDGQTYLLVAKARGVPRLREHPFLRYFGLAVGYGTWGYGSADGEPVSGTRLLYYGITLELSEVLGATAFRDAQTPSWPQRLTDTVLEYVQVPGTALLGDRRL